MVEVATIGRGASCERAECSDILRERGIREWQLYEWKKRLRREEEAQFLAVEVNPSEPVVEAAPPAPVKAIEIRLPKKYGLMAEPGFDAIHLRALLSVLEAEA